MTGKHIHLLAFLLAGSVCFPQQLARVDLGRLQTGATVSFTRTAAGEWSIEIAGGSAPRIQGRQPAKLEVFRTEDDIRQLAAGYKTVQKSASGVDARTEIAYDDKAVFRIEDHWSLAGAVLSVRRKVQVVGDAPGGFYSALLLTTEPSVTWPDADYLAPGLLYGDPTHDGDRSPGGTLNYAARRFWIREDFLSAPLFALSFHNGASVAVLDPSPRGDTTVAEARAEPGAAMTDERFQFGAMGAHQADNGGIEFGYWLPGTVNDYAGGRNEPARPSWRRRYHPIKQGVAHSYQVAFRFGRNESFRDVSRNTWRWAWETLKPAVRYLDIDVVRRTLADHLADRAVTIDGRTGIPFIISTITGKVHPQPNWMMAAMGFVGKNIEAADQLLREADRDRGPRGERMRKIGLDIIDSMIRLVPVSPPQGTGFHIVTGKPVEAVWLRNPTEDMRVLIRAGRRERGLGRQHPEWLRWVKSYVDWLVIQQREDGSFPRRWKPGTSEVMEPSGATSYNPVPLFLLMAEETGDQKYKESAIRAAEYVWANYGTSGVFVGGAVDNPNIVDKEAGMLSMEAFLSLFEATKNPKWLKRAQAAGDFAESWIWIWNVPMPADADDAQLHWKKGVPTIGLQGITARVAGHLDEYLDWAVPSYAKLYNYTKDTHYLDVARILLHDTKAMLALPGRTYDLLGPGWQQEHWRMGPNNLGRGYGSHRSWLPWVSTNHLYGITGLEEYDPVLFKRLSAPPAKTALSSASQKEK